MLASAAQFELLAAAATHVKVRRLQPGALLRLFDGESGSEWPAEVLAIGRSAVQAGIAGRRFAVAGRGGRVAAARDAGLRDAGQRARRFARREGERAWQRRSCR
ncbi:MAG: RNA methyltransferase PUA domain-containing protein [Rubrivivax sp.]